MSRTGVAAAVVAVAAAAVAGAPSGVATARLRRPPLPPPPLAHTLTVDESEWALRPSKRLVGAGPVSIRVYNRGEDDHDLVIVDDAGRAHVVALKPGSTSVLTPDLAPGTYRLFCSLQAGTPESHEARGMWTTLDVR